MALALDTTALLARYLAGPARETVLAAMDADPDWCASALVLSEALMLGERLADDAHSRDRIRRAVRDDWERIHVVPVDQRCINEASLISRAQPVSLGKALHLAAVQRLPGPLSLVTFDPGQITVALGMNVNVISA